MATFTGDANNNNLVGTPDADTLSGLEGNDTLDGLAGNDSIEGGAGYDELTGGPGSDTLMGGAGDDYIVAGGENDGASDTIDGGEGIDIVAYSFWNSTTPITFNATGASGTQVDPSGGTDTLVSIEEFDVYGGSAGDTITGDGMRNFLFGNGGDDTLTGGVGRDSFSYLPTVSNGIDRITDFGAGDDLSFEEVMLNDILSGDDASGLWNGQVMFGTPTEGVTRVYVGVDTVAGADITIDLVGSFVASDFRVVSEDWGSAVYYSVPSEGDDNLGGTWGPDTIDGLGGNDSIDGMDGNDVLQGGAGNDTIAGDTGNDVLRGDAGDDVLYGEAGQDTLVGGAGNDTIDGGTITDTVNFSDLNWLRFDGATTGVVVNLQNGTAQDGQGGTDTLLNINWVTGTQFNDSIRGADSNVFEQFDGGAGNDTLDGGAPVGGLTARATYLSATSGVNVNLAAGTAQDGLGGTDTLLNISHVRGSDFDDTLTGSNTTAYTESFDGRAGNDTIDGAGGTDEYRVDAATTGASVDLLAGTAADGQGGTDTLSNIENVRGSGWNDTLQGSDGANLLRGMAGHDSLLGLAGNDTLQGLDGADTLNGGAGNDTLDGGAITDLVNYSDGNWVRFEGATTGVVVNLATGTAQDGQGGTDTLVNINWVAGTQFNDSITGNNTGIFEMFEGGAGNDTIDGGAYVQGSGARASYQNSTAAVNVTLGGTGSGTASDGMGGTDTLLNIQQVRGSAHADVLTGSDTTAWVEVFDGRAGNDVIDGRGGIDQIRVDGATSGTVIDLSAGTLQDGQGGTDTFSNIEYARGSVHNDSITGSNDANNLQGQGGNDTLAGLDGVDTLQGGDGDDVIDGGAGDDNHLSGGSGNDTVSGGVGNDFIVAGVGEAGNDSIDGGEGHDIVSYTLQSYGSGGSWFQSSGTGTGSRTQSDGQGGTDTLVNIEEVHVYGSTGSDTIIGDHGRNWIHGTGGNDTLTGNDGYDTFSYTAGQSSGTDRINDFGVGGDNIQIQNTPLQTTVLAGDDASGLAQGQVMVGTTASGVTRLYVGTDSVAGADVTIDLVGSYSAANLTVTNDAWGGNIAYTAPALGAPTAGDDNLTGTSGNDFIDAQAGNDTVDGLGGHDNLMGNAGNDVLQGGTGFDRLQGDAGDDTLDGGADADTAVYGFWGSSTGVVFTSTLATGSQADGLGGTDSLSGVEELQVFGGGGDDSITGGDERNFIEGGGGNDTLTGGGGVDFFGFEPGAGNLGVDRITDLSNGDHLHFRNLPVTSVADGDGGGLLRGQVAVGAYNSGTDTTQVFVGVDTVAGADLTIELAGNYAASQFAIVNDSHGNLAYSPGVNLTGTSANDTLNGTTSADTLSGLAGDDNLWGDAGNDSLLGGEGNDFIQGGAGSDTIDGGAGSGDMAAWFDAGAAVNVNLQAGALSGAAAGDVLLNVENLGGSGFNDTLAGNGASNYIDGGAGDDSIAGLDGNDNLAGGTGNDTLDGGNGNDNVTYFGAGGAVNVNLATGTATGAAGTDTLSNIENIGGSEHADTLVGNDANNALNGAGGNDTLQGNGGNDFLEGGAGNDSMSGGAGRDNFMAGAGDDTMDGGAILDRVNYTDLNSVSYANATSGVALDLQTGVVQDGQGGTDTLANINFVTGSAFNDTLTGSSSANLFEQFEGGAGDDTIDGGAVDALQSNGNRVAYTTAGSAVTVNLGAGTATGGGGNDTLLNIQHVTGSNFNDSLVGSSTTWTEEFDGRAGNDTIDGLGGIDIVRYEAGTTAVNVNLATGTATDGQGGTDTLLNVEGVRGSTFNDVLTGGNAASDGLEIFIGGAGNDTIDGGSGYDRVQFNNSTAGVSVTLGGTGTGTAQDGLGGTDTLLGIEAVRGSAFNDTLTGSDTGAFESFEGRQGNDVMDGRGGIDRVDYSGDSAGVVVNLRTGTATDGSGGTDTLANIEDVRGSAFNDALTGNTGNNVLEGGLGNDTLSGGYGADTFAFDTAAANLGLDVVNDLQAGDALLLRNYAGTVTATGDGSAVGAGEIQFGAYDAASNTTRVYVGTDDATGADLTITLLGRFDGADFTRAAEGADIRLTYTPPPEASDNVRGSAEADALAGGGGADTVAGGQGEDTLEGGTGDDFVDGGADNDFLLGGEGTDTIAGGEGNDLAGGGEGGDRMYGDAGDDQLFGDNGDDLLVGGLGNDLLSGGQGNDTMGGDDGNDFIDSNDGDDALYGHQGDDRIVAGSGTDLLAGGGDNDEMAGGGDRDQLFGDDGNDRLFGDFGDDDVIGGSGHDDVSGGAGDDLLGGGDGMDLLVGDAGNDRMYGEADYDRLVGGDGMDLLAGGGGDDQLAGGNDTDFLYGEDGNDQLFGEGGADRVEGGAGNDDMLGGAGSDEFVFTPGSGHDRIFDFQAGAGSEDLLILAGSLRSFEQVQAATRDVGGSAVITIDASTSITLVGVQAATLSVDDFRFA